jgi:UDP-sulfoquinovose synthase
MRILVLGADGYIGFPLSMQLATTGHEVIGIDNFSRRKWLSELGSHSATPIVTMPQRIEAFEQLHGKRIGFEYGELTDYRFVEYIFDKYHPDTIVHMAHQASAPFAMMDVEHATFTQMNNIISTLNVLHAMKKLAPDSHLVIMGSIGEYGAPNIEIPEGFLEIEYQGRKDTLPFPKQAFTDWYHWSKVFNSSNAMLACQIWQLRITDIMQGIVYGVKTDQMIDDRLLTRFDFDAIFGTIVNRFCAEAVLGHNLTVYGTGSQKRPIITLSNTIRCLTLAIENPPDNGEYRVFNQFDAVNSISEIAKRVKAVANSIGINIELELLPNPRIEPEGINYYNPVHEKLYQLGFRPSTNIGDEIQRTLSKIINYRDRIKAKHEHIMPKVFWLRNMININNTI